MPHCDLETDCLCTPDQSPTCEWRSREMPPAHSDEDDLAAPLPLWLTLVLALAGTLIVAAAVLGAMLAFLSLTGWPQ